MIIGFDLDGTLLDSIGVHKEAFLYAAAKIGVSASDLDFFNARSTTAEDMLKRIKPDVSEGEIAAFMRIRKPYLERNIHRMRPFPDTVMTLNELRKSADIFLFSNSEYIDILRYLEHAGLNPLFFEMIVGRDLVEHAKPYPDEIFLAQKLYHHKVDYFIGDSCVDVETGRNARVRTIAVAQGFDTKEALLKEKPFKVVDTLSEILQIIR